MKKVILTASLGMVLVLGAFFCYGRMLEERYLRHQLALLGRLEADPTVFLAEDQPADIANGQALLAQTTYQSEALESLSEPYQFNWLWPVLLVFGSTLSIISLACYYHHRLVVRLAHQLECLANDHPSNAMVGQAQLDHQLNRLKQRLAFWQNENQQTYGRMKNFIEDVAHQLKTPMTTLNIYLGLMDKTELKKLSLRQLKKMETIVNELVKLAKLEAHTFPFSFTWMPFTGLIEQVLERLEPDLAEKDLEVDCQIAPISAYLDALWLEEALFNLIQNAIGHAYPQTLLVIYLTQNESGIHLKIQNQGDPIPAEMMDHLFDRYYTSSPQSNHMGIGLNIAERIISAHHGSLQLTCHASMTTLSIHFDPITGKQK